jgi:hypothetical protein
MGCPCLTTVALPPIFLTIATGTKLSEETFLAVDRRREKTARERTTIFEKACFILDSLLILCLFQTLILQELSQKGQVEGMNDIMHLTQAG